MPIIQDEGVFINVKGVNNVVTALNRINKEVEKQLAVKMAKVVFLVGNSAKGLAAVDTGFMKANIKGSILRQRSIIIGKVISKAPYSVYQEFGTSFQSGKEFMRPALKDNEEKIKELLGQAVIDGTVAVTKNYTVNTQRLI